MFVGLCWFPLKDTLYFFVLSILRIRKQLIKENACKDLVVLRSPSIESGIGWNWESLTRSSTLPVDTVECDHIDSFTALAAAVCISHPDHYCHIQHLFSLHPHHVTMLSLTDLENLEAVS